MHDLTPFGQYIQLCMSDRHLTITDLSRYLSISRQSIYRHLTGITKPSWHTVKIYAEFFGVDHFYLYDILVNPDCRNMNTKGIIRNH